MDKGYLVTVPEGTKIAETTNAIVFDAPKKDRGLYRIKNSALDEARTAGQNEAWALARKIVMSSLNGGYTSQEINDIFGCGNPLGTYTYKAAAEKADAWEEEHRMLEVGTVVKVVDKEFALFGKRGVVISAASSMVGPQYLVLFRDGESRVLLHDEIEPEKDDRIKFVPYNYLYPVVAGGFTIVWPLILVYRVGTILKNLTKRRK